MAYPTKIRTAARRLWMEGYSYDKVVEMLKRRYPKEPTPSKEHTIISWSQTEDWAVDKALMDVKTAEIRRNDVDLIASDLIAEENRDKKIMETALSHIRVQMSKRDPQGKPMPIDHKAINNLVNAADKAIRRKRINRLGYDTRNEHSGEVGTVVKFEMIQGGILGQSVAIEE